MSAPKRLGYIAMTDYGPVTDGKDALVFPTYEDASACLDGKHGVHPVVSVWPVIRARMPRTRS